MNARIGVGSSTVATKKKRLTKLGGTHVQRARQLATWLEAMADDIEGGATDRAREGIEEMIDRLYDVALKLPTRKDWRDSTRRDWLVGSCLSYGQLARDQGPEWRSEDAYNNHASMVAYVHGNQAPDKAELAKQCRPQIVELIRAKAENTGGERAKVRVDDAIEQLCTAMDYPVGRPENVRRVGRKRKRPTGG